MSEGATFNCEITREGREKLAAMKSFPQASRKLLEGWLSGVQILAMRNAKAMQKSSKPGMYTTAKTRGHKSGQMANNIGFQIEEKSHGIYNGYVGTGIGGKQKIKYAKIQDEGGVTHPTVTDKMRRFAWAMFMMTNTKKSKATGAYMWKYLALTKQSKLTVNIPASNWFTGAIDTNKQLLFQMLEPENLMRYAKANFGGE